MDKLTIKACLEHKPIHFEPSECVVEKTVSLPHEQFQELMDEPLRDHDFISENRMSMYCDENEIYHCLLVYDEQSGDGLLIDAEGYDYARYSAYIHNAKGIIEQYELKQSGLQTVKAPITAKEKSLLDLVAKAADRMGQYAHMGKKDLYFEDVLKDLGYSFDEVKEMFIHAAAQKLSAKEDIYAVEVSDLGIPFQPELTVITNDDRTADIGGLSY